mgnify:CR=1 FL=1
MASAAKEYYNYIKVASAVKKSNKLKTGKEGKKPTGKKKTGIKTTLYAYALCIIMHHPYVFRFQVTSRWQH